MKPVQLRQWLMVSGLFCILYIRAQPAHYNAWFRGTVSVPASKKIKTDAEVQYRRQNAYSSANPFDKELMLSARSWVHYQHTPHVKFSVSPFACFFHHKIIMAPGDEQQKPAREIRFAAAADVQHKITGKLKFNYRPCVEYRLLSNYALPVTRIRNRIGLRYTIGFRSKAFIYDELLLTVTGVNRKHLFDHNRTAIGFEYNIIPMLRLEAGGMYLVRLPLSNTIRVSEVNFFLNFIYTVPDFL